jgi:1-acyl-sn-glycerol-3-phosphate acyltransferase
LPWFYYVGRALVKATLFTFTRWKVEGRENIPGEGPLLIVANHLNNADPPLISVSLKRKTMFMAKEELFRSRFIGYFMKGFGAFPVHRGRLDRQALRQAEEVLHGGMVLVMFPEAMRSKSGKLQAAFPGSALIAMHCRVPILPVGITGTERMKHLSWMLHHPRILVNIGKPFRLPKTDGKVSRADLDKSTNLIMGHIAELLPVEYRGYYTDKVER